MPPRILPRERTFMIFYLILAAIIIAADQLTKLLAVFFLAPITTLPLIPKVFHLTYVENTGAAFSLLAGRSAFLILLTAALIAALIALLVRQPKTRAALPLNLALTMVIGGALGNLIDRLHYGYVVDFFDCRIVGFAVFNVADCFVVVGCVLVVVSILRAPGLAEAPEAAPREKKRRPRA